MIHTGRFTDDEPETAEAIEDESPRTWDKADEGDRRYDIWAEQQMEDRHNWPGNEDTQLAAALAGLKARQTARTETLVQGHYAEAAR